MNEGMSVRLENLNISAKIAELQGATNVTLDIGVKGKIPSMIAWFKLGDGFSYQEPIADHGYSPVTDKALNLDLRDKYDVTVNYTDNFVFIPARGPRGVSTVAFTDKSQINRAVCLCIIDSSKGLAK